MPQAVVKKMIVLYDMLFKIYFWPNCQNLTNFFFLVSENSLPLLLRCLYGRFFFPKIPILGQKYFLFSQVLLLQIVLYPSSFQRLIIINSDIDLLKTAFWQTANWSQCWKFYSDQTRMKSLLRRLKNVISMVS